MIDMAKHSTRKNGTAGKTHTMARKVARGNKYRAVPLDVAQLEKELTRK